MLQRDKQEERRRRLLLKVLTGGAPYTVLGEDELNVALAAGAINGTLATDGINARTVVDSTNKLAESVANGFEFTGAAGLGDPGAWYPAQVRVGGLTAAVRVKPVSGTIIHLAGWDTNQAGSGSDGVYFVTGALRAWFNNGGAQRDILSGVYSNGSTYDVIVSHRPTIGTLFIIKGGAFTDWTLGFVSIFGTTSPVYPNIEANSAAASGTFYGRKIKWGVLSQFTTQYGIATERKAVSVNGDTITSASGDGIIEHTIVAATGVTQELMVRRTDDNNCVIIRMDQGAGTIKVYEKNAGVETEKTGGTTTQTWTNGSSYRIHVSLYGTAIKVTVATVNKNDATGSGFNASVTGVKVSHAGTDLIAWPSLLTGAAKAELDAFFP